MYNSEDNIVDGFALHPVLQHVRELSRQQFMARATIMKARLTAGLPTYGEPV